MRIHVQLIAETPDSSLSVLSIAGKAVCFVLEDGFRAVKVPGETRIPPGVYKIAKRKAGKFYAQYRQKYRHEFSIELENVPGFSDILIHIGNTVFDSRGCLLVGRGVDFNGRYSVVKSEPAYLEIYSLIKQAFDEGEQVEIEISRELWQRPGA